jgi:hypothetical protein
MIRSLEDELGGSGEVDDDDDDDDDDEEELLLFVQVFDDGSALAAI